MFLFVKKFVELFNILLVLESVTMTNKKVALRSGFGIALKHNPYGKSFDAAAKRRMVANSLRLLPLLEKNGSELGASVLEIGPFTDPLVTKGRFAHVKSIFYCDVDRNVVDELRKIRPEAISICADASTQDVIREVEKFIGDELTFSATFQVRAGETISLCFEKKVAEGVWNAISGFGGKFGAIVISQVLNYVDYKKMVSVARELLAEGGLLFVNNVVGNGIPELFSQKRPKSLEETVRGVARAGFEIIEKAVEKTKNPECPQEDRRLLLVARKK